MKTKEELNAIKEEIETLNKKLAELSEEELEQIYGGVVVNPQNNDRNFILVGSRSGGVDEHTIPLPDSPEFWHSWNPGFPTNHDDPDKNGFIG